MTDIKQQCDAAREVIRLYEEKKELQRVLDLMRIQVNQRKDEIGNINVKTHKVYNDIRVILSNENIDTQDKFLYRSCGNVTYDHLIIDLSDATKKYNDDVSTVSWFEDEVKRLQKLILTVTTNEECKKHMFG
jgi:predicted membrane-bound spermidine synthase